MTTRTWRDMAKERIAEVRKDHPTASGDELKKLLRNAYPFGERAMHPYKIWLDEVKKTLSDPAAGKNLRTFWTEPR